MLSGILWGRHSPPAQEIQRTSLGWFWREALENPCEEYVGGSKVFSSCQSQLRVNFYMQIVMALFRQKNLSLSTFELSEVSISEVSFDALLRLHTLKVM